MFTPPSPPRAWSLQHLLKKHFVKLYTQYKLWERERRSTRKVTNESSEGLCAPAASIAPPPRARCSSRRIVKGAKGPRRNENSCAGWTASCFSSESPETVAKRLQCVGQGQSPRLLPAHYVQPPTYHPHPPVISHAEKDWHVYAPLPVSQLSDFGIYELASFKKAEKKCLFVGLTFLLSLFYFFLSQKKKNYIKTKRAN